MRLMSDLIKEVILQSQNKQKLNLFIVKKVFLLRDILTFDLIFHCRLMQKLYQKQQQDLITQQQLIKRQYQRLTKKYINQNQCLKVTFEYCLKAYSSSQKELIIPSFEQYSSTQISKKLLKSQLTKIKEHFQRFPNQSCKLEHFIMILVTVMSIEFQEVPKYLVGFIEIFKQVSNHEGFVQYQDFFYYVIGEVATLSQQEQNTEFQIHFEELKKQDYLLHDNGIKKILFLKDMKLYLVLDENSESLKIYNQEMKIIKRFTPSKDKHNNRCPKMTSFDFNQFSNKLGIAYSDGSVELVNLVNFLTRSREDFEKMYLSYEMWQVEEVIVEMEFLQMTNKWLGLTENNRLVVYDLERPKESTDQLMTEIQLWNQPKQQQKISSMIEIVPMSLICIVAGNQIFFFGQKLTQKKYKNYKHGSTIKLVRFCQQKNSFYILGEQKHLTILTVQRNSHQFRLSSYPLNHIVKDFEIFPQLDTILMTDSQHYVFLYDLKTMLCYQGTLYAHIAKKQHRHLRILKTSRSEFLIFQSYMLSMIQEKVALQKQVEYNIDHEAHYDEHKEQLYLSINNQILNINILRRELIKSYNQENYHLPKQFFHYLIDQNNQILVLDAQMNLSFVEKKHKDGKREFMISKNFDTQEGRMLKYNREKGMMYFLGRDQLFEVKNNANLSTVRQLIFQNFGFITCHSYCQKSNSLLLSTQTHHIYLINLNQFSVQKKIHLFFPRDKSILQEVKCIKCHYLTEFKVFLLLTNNNLLYLVDFMTMGNSLCLRLLDAVTYGQVDVDFRFTKMTVEVIEQKEKERRENAYNVNENLRKSSVYVMLATDDGHFLKLNISHHLAKLHSQSCLGSSQTSTPHLAVQTNKNKYLLNSKTIQAHQCQLNPQIHIKISKNTCEFSKRHEKEIIVMKIIYLEKYLTLTVAKDGEIKLTGEGNKTICITRLPNLAKKQWNTQEIEKIKITKLMVQIKQVLTKICSYIQTRKSPKKILQTIKKNKQTDHDFRKLNHDQPIPIEIQTKKIEDIIRKEVLYETPQEICDQLMMNTSPSFRLRRRFQSSGKLQEASKTFAHPWREKKSFVEMFENLPADDKYGKKIPNQLKNLRRSLDMIPKQSKLPAQKLDIKIIPQLSSYKFEEKLPLRANPQETSEILNNKKQDFQSCYFIKSRRKMRKSNINDFDQIDKEFYKKQVSFNKRYIPKKEDKKEDEYLESKLSKTFNLKKAKRPEIVLDYNMMPHRVNPIGSILELFEKHNKEVAGTKNGRQIRISKDLSCLRSKSFDNRY